MPGFSEYFDLVIRNGRVIDGSGKPAQQIDIGIRRDRIVAVDRLRAAGADQIIDATGKVVCPGFIDPHVHSELELLEGQHTAGVQMGVTTQLLAADGLSFAPLSSGRLEEYRLYNKALYGAPHVDWDWHTLDEYLTRFEGRSHNNVVAQVPHGAVRLEAMGWAPRPATEEELSQMCDLTRQCMEEGAVGLCNGLAYLPMAYADTQELVALSRVVAEYGGIYASHMRDYGDRVAESTAEMVRIADAAGIAVQVSHFSGTPETYATAEEAHNRGVDITWDAYPYRAGCTTLAYHLPLDVQEGGPRATLKRLTDSAVRAQVRTAYEVHSSSLEIAHFAYVTTPENKHLEGQTFGEAWRASGKRLEEFICDLLVEEEMAVLMVYHRAEGDEKGERRMRNTLTHPLQMVGTDGVYVGSKPHPRGFGTYPRILGRYVREKEWLSLEEAIRKMTGFPADRFSLGDRGRLEPGCAADIVVFDPQRIMDRATYEEPQEAPVGIEHVFVNGVAAVSDGQVTGARPGRVLRPAWAR